MQIKENPEATSNDSGVQSNNLLTFTKETMSNSTTSTLSQMDYANNLKVRVNRAQEVLNQDHPSKTAMRAAHLRDQATRYWQFMGNPDVVEIQMTGSNQKEYAGLTKEGKPKFWSRMTTDLEDFIGAALMAEEGSPKAVYTHINTLDENILAHQKAGVWKVATVSGQNFVAVNQFYIDVDPHRGKGENSLAISATDEEKAKSWSTALKIYIDFATFLGDDNSLAMGMSGNGYQVHIALESIVADSRKLQSAITEKINKLFRGLGNTYSSEGIILDKSVKDVKRLAPLWGTGKRKGEDGIADRPYRYTWIATPETTKRLPEAQFDALVEHFGADEDKTVKTTSNDSKVKSQGWDEVLSKISALDPEHVSNLLNLSRGGKTHCPGCDLDDCKIYHVPGKDFWGYACRHNRCVADAGGEAGNGNGFRGPVQATMCVHKLDWRGAVMWLCEQYSIDKPKGKAPAQYTVDNRKKGDDEWENNFTRQKDGSVSNLITNFELIMAHDFLLNGAIGYCEFSHRVYSRKDLPWAKVGEEWRDEYDTKVRLHIAKAYGVEFGVDITRKMIDDSAFNNKFHPVRDYLLSLSYKGNISSPSHVETWLIDCAGAPDTSYIRAVSKYWIMSAAARILKPGCKADYTLVLEGDQGLAKSSLLEVLAGTNYYAAIDGNLTDRDTKEGLLGMWIVEFGEFASLMKTSGADAKNYLTAKKDRIAIKYKARTASYERQCVYAATVNPDGGYLTDPTGNRRYWPIPCAFIDLDKLSAIRDQLWAEAVALVKAGEKWYPDREEEALHFRNEQDARREIDPWENDINAKLHGLISVCEKESDVHDVYTSISEVLLAIGVQKERHDMRTNNRARRILTALQWVQDKPRKVEGVTVRVYVPKNPVAAYEAVKRAKDAADEAKKAGKPIEKKRVGLEPAPANTNAFLTQIKDDQSINEAVARTSRV